MTHIYTPKVGDWVRFEWSLRGHPLHRVRPGNTDHGSGYYVEALVISVDEDAADPTYTVWLGDCVGAASLPETWAFSLPNHPDAATHEPGWPVVIRRAEYRLTVST